MFPAEVADPVTAGLLHSAAEAAAAALGVYPAARLVAYLVAYPVEAVARVVQRSASQGAVSR